MLDRLEYTDYAGDYLEFCLDVAIAELELDSDYAFCIKHDDEIGAQKMIDAKYDEVLSRYNLAGVVV
jgi:hypothetical protein